MDYTRFFAKRVARRPENLIRKFTEMRSLHPEAITFAGGMPNPATFPIKAMSITYPGGVVKNLSGTDLNASLQYGPSQGHLPLVQIYRKFQRKLHDPPMKEIDVVFMPGSQEGFCKILDLLLNEGEPIMVQVPTYTATLGAERWHSPPNKFWDLHVVAGSQDGLGKIFEAFVNVNDAVMVQAPFYFGVVGAIHPLVPDFIGIQQDADGIIPEEIKKVCEGRIKRNEPLPKLLYVNPIGANPTGAVLTHDRKRRVYELAQEYNFLIIEDDPYYFLHFLDKQPVSFLSMDIDGRVIRLDSFSKIISAGLRLGVVTAHKEIIGKLITHVENSVLHSSSLSQMLIYKLFETWSHERFEQHFKEIQKFYRQKRDVMLAAAEKHLTGIAEWSVPKAGMFLWIKITAIDNALDLAMDKLVPSGIFVIPGNAFNYDGTEPDQHLRLSYSFATSDEVEKGLSIIAKIVRDEAAKTKNNK